jgi:hypothetical protein
VTASDQQFPDVAYLPTVGYVVAWDSAGQDGNGDGVFARRFDAAANPLDANEVQLNTYTTSSQRMVKLAALPTGGFVAAWQSYGQDGDYYGIFARRFDDTFNPLDTPEFPVNTVTAGHQSDPAVAADSAGNFTIVWESNAQDGDLWGVFARRFAANGAPLDSVEFPVNLFTAGEQANPDIAVTATGEFVIVWESWDQDGDFFGVFAQRYDNLGDPVGLAPW